MYPEEILEFLKDKTSTENYDRAKAFMEDRKYVFGIFKRKFTLTPCVYYNSHYYDAYRIQDKYDWGYWMCIYD